MKILIQNGRVLDPASGLDRTCDVALAAGRIVGLGRTPADFAPARRIDAAGCCRVWGISLPACASRDTSTKACWSPKWRRP